MNKHLLGVIDAWAHQEELKGLTQNRPVAAVPFGGRYRLIDFTLSSMVNSGIQSVAIFPTGPYRSLMDHLESGKYWDLDRKKDGLFFFPSAVKRTNDMLDRFAANIDFFRRSTQEYTLITSGNTVLNMDFRPLLQFHLESGCDITEVGKKGKPLGIYLLKTSLLLEMIKKRERTGYSNLKDAIVEGHPLYRVCEYEYDGYAAVITTNQEYYSASMDLLQPIRWKELFLKNRPVLTKVKDEAPTHYLSGASVKNAVVANGSMIEGEVENSILFRGVRIGKDSSIRNSVIMQKCVIGEGCVLDSVILDKGVKIEDGTVLAGSGDVPYIVSKGTVQGALMNS